MNRIKKYFISIVLSSVVLCSLVISSCSITKQSEKNDDNNKTLENFINNLNINLTPTELGKNTLPSNVIDINKINDYVIGIPNSSNGVNINVLEIIDKNDTSGSLTLKIMFSNGIQSIVNNFVVIGLKKTSIKPSEPSIPDSYYLEKLDIEVKRFNVNLKSDKIIDQLYPSVFLNMVKFKEYFEWEKKPSFTYNFNIQPDDKKGELKVSVVITILDDQNNPIYNDEKIFPVFTGFAKKVDIVEYNKEILNKALNALQIAKKVDISNITTNQYLENKFENFEKYFQVNKNDVELLGPNIYVDLRPIKSIVKRGEFETIIFTHKIFVGQGQNKVSGEKEISISGFKKLLSDLDSSKLVNLTTPQNAKSYKGLVQPLSNLITSSSSNYTDSLKKFDWEQYKLEMIYQVRFYMYQIFKDNFSEINYYTIGGDNVGDEFSTIAEGIIKEDMPNLFGYLQSYGGTVKFTNDFYAGQKIKLVINQRKESTGSWMPSAAIITNFSFDNSCINIPNTSIKIWGSLMSSDRSFTWNLSVDDKEFSRSIETWNMRTYMFTIGKKR